MERLLTERQVAERLAVSPSTLQKWRHYRVDGAPAFVRNGRSIRYAASEVDDWIARRVEAARAAQAAGGRP